MKDETLDLIISEKNKRKTVIVATEINSGKQVIVNENKNSIINNKILLAIKNNITTGKSEVVDIEKKKWFINISLPPLRLITVGAVHIAQPLAEVATICGYEVIIIDPRAAFGNNQRFPDIKIINDWPEVALNNLQIDNRTAVVTLTHDPKLDDSALNAALKSNAFYIGSLGSKKTHNARIQRLKRANYTDAEISKIHGPVGLSIGAKSPQEIAISIISQIISKRNNFENNEDS